MGVAGESGADVSMGKTGTPVALEQAEEIHKHTAIAHCRSDNSSEGISTELLVSRPPCDEGNFIVLVLQRVG